MALHINNERTDRLARQLARRTGESITDAVTSALEARLKTTLRNRTPEERYASAMNILKQIDALPVLDNRSADEVLGYDKHGLPTYGESS
jgi:antitoxin VapB